MRKILLLLFVYASPALLYSQSGPETLGQWSSPLTASNNKWPNDIAVHMSLLPTGKILVWGRGTSHVNKTSAYIWDPATETVVASNLQTGNSNLFCSSHTLLPNGNVMAISGHDQVDAADNGIVDANIFNYQNNTWMRVADMSYRRWYPAAVTMPDGTVVTLSGSDAVRGINHGTSNTGVYNPGVPEVEKYDYKTNTWSTVTLNTSTPDWYDYYPFLHVAPNGQIFDAGAAFQTKFISISGTSGAITGTINRFHNVVRDYGSSVMVGSKVITFGGGAPNSDLTPLYYNNRPGNSSSLWLSTNTAEIIDLAAATPTWSAINATYNRRRHANATLLPDGTVAVTGGTQWYDFVPGSQEEQTGWTDFALSNIGGTSLNAREVANASLPDGRIEVYVVNQAGSILRSEQTSINGVFSAFTAIWVSQPLLKPRDIAVVRHPDNSADLVMVDYNGAIRLNHFDNVSNTWSGFTTQISPGTIARRVALTSFPDKRLDVYITDANQNLYRAEQLTVNGSFSSFSMIGSTANLAIDIDAVRHSDGTADFVMAGIDNNMWLSHFDPAATPQWAGFTLIGTPQNKGQRIALAARPDKSISFFFEGMDGNIWNSEKPAPNIGWLGWNIVGNYGNMATSIDAVKRLDGYFDVVMGGLDYQAWHAWSFGPVYQTEIYNPTSGAWSALASMSIRRVYHSTALLLPDGRVLTAGGGAGGAGSSDHPDAQIYSPPYLFKGARPVVSSAVSTINHGTTFNVNYTGNAIQKVTLVSLGSVTHSYNMNQRFLPLSFTNAGSGSLTVTAPLNCNIAPPGYYMLFLVDNNGVPSIGKIVQVYDLANPPARKSVADSAQQQEIVVRDLKGFTIETRKKLLSANDNLALYLSADNEKLVIATSGKFDSKGWNAKVINNRSATVLKQDLTRGICKSGKGDQCDCPTVTDIDISKLADGAYTVIVASDKQTQLKTNFVKQMSRFMVYPNPAANEVSVKFNNAFSYSLPVKDYLSSVRNIERIRVFDNAGREVLNQANCAGSAACKVDVSSLPAGFYVLKVYTKEETEEHKIIVAH
jgi:hypothetical protein